jgi:cell division transport system permease protein
MARNSAGDLRPSWLSRFAQDHLRVLLFSLSKLKQNPGGALLTAVVIGITLALPASLHMLVNNVSRLSYSWEGALQTSLYLKDGVTQDRGQALSHELAERDDVARTHYISREEALEEFRKTSGFGQALDLIESNPLPAVITVTPKKSQTKDQVGALVAELAKLPEVEQAKLDQQWLERLYAILDIVQRGVLVVAVLLALAVFVTVGNTIRLDIQSRREEIEVMKLIGASDRFIRRPFLYAGLWFGLAGGLIALLLVNIGLLVLSGPVQHLAGIYESNFALAGLSFEAALTVFTAGIVLGWLGAFITVTRHLKRIEPS